MKKIALITKVEAARKDLVVKCNKIKDLTKGTYNCETTVPHWKYDDGNLPGLL